MKFINLYAIVLSIMLMLPQFIAAGENNNPAALPFKVVNIPGNDIPDNLNTESISKIKQPLQNEGYYLDEYRPGLMKV